MFNVWFDQTDEQYCLVAYRFVDGKRVFSVSIDLSCQELTTLRDCINAALAKELTGDTATLAEPHSSIP